MRQPKNIKKYRIIFVTVIVIAIVARILGINNLALSPEDVTLLSYAELPFKTQMTQFSYATSFVSPLYALILHGWIALFGTSDGVLRALTIFISIAAIFPLFGIARILFNKRISYTAILLYAVSPLAIDLSHTLSPVPLLTLFSLMSTWGLLMMIRRSNPEYRIFYFFTIFGAIYTHPAFWFLFLFHQIVAVSAFFHHESRHLIMKQWLIFQGIFGIAIALTMPEVLPSVHLPFDRGWATPLTGLGIYLFVQCGSLLLSIAILALLYQLFFNSRRYQIVYRHFVPKLVQVIIWIVAVGLPPFLFNFEQGDFGRANGAVTMLPPFLLLVSAAIDTFEHKRRRQLVIGILAIFSILAFRSHNEIPTAVSWDNLMADQSGEGGYIVETSLYNTYKHYSSNEDHRSSSEAIIISEDSLEFQPSLKSLSDTSITLHFVVPVEESLAVDRFAFMLNKEFEPSQDSTYSIRSDFNQSIPSIRRITLQRIER